MSLWSHIVSTLRNFFRRQQVESQLDDEVRSYVDLIADERIAAGMSPSEARRTALADSGGIEQVKQAVRDRRAGAGIELLWQDARYGLRQLWRNPGFTVTVILTLALSIGANTAIFSIVNALMLHSLPYPHPERMGTIFTRIRGPIASDERHHVNGEQFELLRDNVPSLISARLGHPANRSQSPGRVLTRPVRPRRTHLPTLPRRARNPPPHRTQLLHRGRPSARTEDRHHQLRPVAQHLRIQSPHHRAKHSAQR